MLYKNKIIKNKKVKLFKPQGDFVPWRFCFTVKNNTRNKLLSRIRELGFDISSWYPNAKNWFKEGRKQKGSSSLSCSFYRGIRTVTACLEKNGPKSIFYPAVIFFSHSL